MRNNTIKLFDDRIEVSFLSFPWWVRLRLAWSIIMKEGIVFHSVKYSEEKGK